MNVAVLTESVLTFVPQRIKGNSSTVSVFDLDWPQVMHRLSSAGKKKKQKKTTSDRKWRQIKLFFEQQLDTSWNFPQQSGRSEQVLQRSTDICDINAIANSHWIELKILGELNMQKVLALTVFIFFFFFKCSALTFWRVQYICRGL